MRVSRNPDRFAKLRKMQITIDNGHVRCKKDAQVLPAACRIHDLPNTAERILRRCTRSGFILGTLAASTLPARAQPRARIRIGVVPAETSAQAFYAKEMGFFAKAGLDVDIHVFSSASLITSAVASNSIDVGWSSLVKIITAHARQIRLVAIAPASLYLSAAPNGAIFVAANSHVRSAKDLNNTVFAVTELGTISEYGSRAWIDRNGGSSASVLFAGMEDSTMFDALDHGLVDAAYFTEPSLGIAKKRERFLAYPYGSFAKDFLFGTWFTMSQWAKDYPDLVAKFSTAIREAGLWANANRSKSAEILAKVTKVDPAIVDSMVRARYADRMTPAMMQPEIDVVSKYGDFPPFAAQDMLYQLDRSSGTSERH
jgi:ABC-type nitrate/sulfonate/bicarbonate transport system substrate-binding protein